MIYSVDSAIQVLNNRARLTLGTLRSDNGDVHDNSSSFQTISRLSQVAQLLKRREFMLEGAVPQFRQK